MFVIRERLYAHPVYFLEMDNNIFFRIVQQYISKNWTTYFSELDNNVFLKIGQKLHFSELEKNVFLRTRQQYISPNMKNVQRC